MISWAEEVAGGKGELVLCLRRDKDAPIEASFQGRSTDIAVIWHDIDVGIRMGGGSRSPGDEVGIRR